MERYRLLTLWARSKHAYNTRSLIDFSSRIWLLAIIFRNKGEEGTTIQYEEEKDSKKYIETIFSPNVSTHDYKTLACVSDAIQHSFISHEMTSWRKDLTLMNIPHTLLFRQVQFLRFLDDRYNRLLLLLRQRRRFRICLKLVRLHRPSRSESRMIKKVSGKHFINE